MPLYEFRCGQGHVTEKLVAGDTEEVRCRTCASPAGRIMSPPAAFDLRGPGFYATDYGGQDA